MVPLNDYYIYQDGEKMAEEDTGAGQGEDNSSNSSTKRNVSLLAVFATISAAVSV
jgi:hypothetical protein